MPQRLPIYEVVDDVKHFLRIHNTLILQAAPGAGKSTALPLELIHEPWLANNKILILEPRRLAARNVATRMAATLSEVVGETIGYRIRFDHKVSGQTRVEVLTEGILTRLIQHDSLLEGIGLIIFDEFHERSLHADLSLALCREIQQILRPDLRLLIMSATMDHAVLSNTLGDPPVVLSEGRQHPIEYVYVSVDALQPFTREVFKVICQAHKEQVGDILVFLPGVSEILKVKDYLEASTLVAGCDVCLLYGDMSDKDQQVAIRPNVSGKRKIVLSTSIAETSITIEGIRIVIDSGLCRVPRYDPKSGLSKLVTIPVTMDVADQRAGRAGRTQPGICYRMWDKVTNHHLKLHRTPEILEADLGTLYLELAQWGGSDSMKWITPPPSGAMSQTADLLFSLHALDASSAITDKGKKISDLPTHPRIAHMLLESNEKLHLAIDIASVLEEKDPFDKGSETDITFRIEVLRKWRRKERVNANTHILERIERLASYWRKRFSVQMDNSPPAPYEVGSLLVLAYPDRVAKRVGASFKLSNGRSVLMPTNDTLSLESWIVAAQLDVGNGKEGRVYLAAPLDPEYIHNLFTPKDVIEWDDRHQELVAQRQMRFSGLIVETKPLMNVDELEVAKVLTEVIKTSGRKLLDWNEEVMQWQARIKCASLWDKSTEWPDVSIDALLMKCDEWFIVPFKQIKCADDFKKISLLPLLESIVSWEKQQLLEQLCPKTISVPTGSAISMLYNNEGQPPILAVRLQEMFGMIDTPTVCNGTQKVMLHLLSPGYKPVQVTQDLRSFWTNTYAQVRKELRSRYPKHHWPDDPWTAEPVRGVKKRIN